MSRFWEELKAVSIKAATLLSSVTTRVRLLRAIQEVDLDHKAVVPAQIS